jgi:hypothetical protein
LAQVRAIARFRRQTPAQMLRPYQELIWKWLVGINMPKAQTAAEDLSV